MFLSDKKSASGVINIIQNLKYCSGLKIIQNKTEAKWIGSYWNFPQEVYQ